MGYGIYANTSITSVSTVCVRDPGLNGEKIRRKNKMTGHRRATEKETGVCFWTNTGNSWNVL